MCESVYACEPSLPSAFSSLAPAFTHTFRCLLLYVPAHAPLSNLTAHLVPGWLKEKYAKEEAWPYRNATALHLAAMYGDAEILQILLNSGLPVDVGAVNAEGYTALAIALQNLDVECIEVLSDHPHCNLCKVDSRKATALTFLCRMVQNDSPLEPNDRRSSEAVGCRALAVLPKVCNHMKAFCMTHALDESSEFRRALFWVVATSAFDDAKRTELAGANGALGDLQEHRQRVEDRVWATCAHLLDQGGLQSSRSPVEPLEPLLQRFHPNLHSTNVRWLSLLPPVGGVARSAFVIVAWAFAVTILTPIRRSSPTPLLRR